MIDETKNLFDAPWTVTVEEIRKDTKRFAVVKNNLDYELVAIDLTHEDAHRLARLPELYDALMEARKEMFIMLNEWALGKSESDYLASYRERKGKNNYEFFNGIQELLKKVRDGE